MLAVLIWIVISHVLWQNVTQDLEAKAIKIKNAPSAAAVIQSPAKGVR